jgi:hypothetical protein
MPSTRETILQALHLRLKTLNSTVLRGSVLPERIPAGGLVILRDGDPGEPEVTLSPLRYHYRHVAEVEVIVQGGDHEDGFDRICRALGDVYGDDRTLGGLCDWVEGQAPEPVDLPVEGAPSLKAAVIPIVLHYAVANPLQ